MVLVQYSLPDKDSLGSSLGLQAGDNNQHVVRLEYLAEGNANVIYRIKSLEENELPVELQSRLLRLRKDKSFIQSTRDQHAAYQQNFAPLFHKQNHVQQTLISLEKDMLAALNSELDNLQTSAARAKLRHDDKLALEEDYGTLMTDMTARSDEVLLELKPKWLLQSPDAPSGATRCRTCALRAQRLADKAKGGLTPESQGFCPLSLIYGTVEERYRSAQDVVRPRLEGHEEDTVQHVANILIHGASAVLETLKFHQSRLDPSGVLGLPAEHVSKDFLMAMTLRDCTMLIRTTVQRQANNGYELRLVDLDLKQADPGKVTKWKHTERRLIEEGWYLQPGKHNSRDDLCYLSR